MLFFNVNYTFLNHYINLYKLILNEKGRIQIATIQNSIPFLFSPNDGKKNLKLMFIKIYE